MTDSPLTFEIGGNNRSTEFDGVIQDGDGTGYVALNKVGTGALTLGGANTYTGGTTITQGTLRGLDSSFGTASIALAGGTLSSNGTLGNDIVVTGQSGIDAYLSPLTLTGSILGTGWPAISHTVAQLNLAGDDSGYQGYFSQTGDDSSVTCFTSAGAGSARAIWQIDSGVLESDIDGTATIQLGSLFCDGTLENASSSPVTYDIGANCVSSTSCGAVIDGAGPVALKKVGGGTMTFTSTANSYSGGTTIDGGVFRVDSAGELPGYDTSGAVIVNNGGTVAVAVGAGRWTASDIATLLANATFNNGSALGIDTTCGSFTYTNAITGSLGITKLGANSLTLTGTNTYAGATTVAEGTLRAETPGQLDTAGGVVVDSGATLALNVGGSGEWTASDLSNLLGHATFNSGSILGLDTTGGDFEYDNSIGGDLGLVKLGVNTLTLPQANTYAGGTDLAAGGLMIGSNASLGSGALTLGGGTLLTDSTLTLDIPIVAADSTTSCVDANGTLTLDGSISGAGRIDCTGSDENSVLNLGGGDNSGFSGELDLGPGATHLTSASAGSSLAAWVLDGGVLANNVSGTPMIALGSLSGSGTLTDMAAGSTVTYQIGGADQSIQFAGVVNGVFAGVVEDGPGPSR